MTLFEAVVLGIIQGLTEFLPISSSGHLVIVESLMGNGGQDATFEIFLHFGTFLSICIVFRRELAAIARSILRCISMTGSPDRLRSAFHSDSSMRLAAALLIGTIPAGIIGVVWAGSLEAFFSEPRSALWFLLVTGFILLSTRWAREKDKPVTLVNSILLGLAQVLAVLPGISRSGITISAALHLGISRIEAARFSFLLALPAILGATVLKGLSFLSGVGTAGAGFASGSRNGFRFHNWVRIDTCTS